MQPGFLLCVMVLLSFWLLSDTWVVVWRFALSLPEPSNRSWCPQVPADCLAEDVLDCCGCWPECACREDEPCGSLEEPDCTKGMECVLGSGPGASATVRRRTRAGVCTCSSSELVYGSDEVSTCELKQVSNKAAKLQQPPAIFIQW